MSPLWLILIVPAAFIAGYVMCGMFSNAEQEDRCRRCFMTKKDEEA